MFEPIILGTIQGIFEWLPISSQGNLILVMVGIFGIGITVALKYSIFLHFGTFLAVLVYFRKDVIKILSHFKKYKPGFKKRKDGLISFLIISTFITGIVGYPLFKLVSNINIRGEIFIGLIGLALILTGFLQKFSFHKKIKKQKDLNFKDSIILGVLQGLALIPGISRSGITLSGFLLKKYSPKQSLYLSFLMSIPVLFIGSVFIPLSEGFPQIEITSLILGLAFSFIFGILTIKILLSLAQKIKFWTFCVFIGVLALVPFIIYLF